MRFLRLAFLALSLFCSLHALAAPTVAEEVTPIKRQANPPPSADLFYAIQADYSALSMSGEGVVRWSTNGKRFSVRAETTTPTFGKLLESQSKGVITAYGLAPTDLIEKRFRKPPHTVTFDHRAKTIRFSASQQTYPIKGGEQDRTSITWQIVSIARGAPVAVQPGAEWSFFVAGRKNAEAWTFRVVGEETVSTPMGDFSAIHIKKLPSKSRENQQLNLWLAPALDWYPVQMVFKDTKGIDLYQTLQRIDRREQAAANARQTP